MFLRRAFVEGRRSAPCLVAYPSRLLHAPPLVTLKERTSTSEPPVHYKASHVATQAIQDTRPSRFQDDVDRFYEALTAHPEHGITKLPQVHDFMEAFVVYCSESSMQVGKPTTSALGRHSLISLFTRDQSGTPLKALRVGSGLAVFVTSCPTATPIRL